MQIIVPGLTHDAILDASPIPTSVVDAEGTVVYVNDAFLVHASKALGKKIRRGDRVGSSVREFITGRGDYEQQEWLNLYDRVLKNGESIFLQEFHGRPLSGEERYMDVRMNPMQGGDGKVIGAVVTWQDVTDRVRRQREERRRAALDRLRRSVYEMRKSADIQEVSSFLYEVLKDVGVDFEDCSVSIVDEGKEKFECYYLGPDGMHSMTEVPLSNSAVYEAWRTKRPIYRPDLDEEDRYNEGSRIREDSGKHIRSVLDVLFSRGTLAINSIEADHFSEEDFHILESFGEVLSEGYTRFEDIQRIERRAALDRVRVSVYAMREAKDIQSVLVSLYGALKDIGVEFDACSVEIVDEDEGVIEDYDLGPDRMHLRMNRLPLRDSAVYEAWRIHRPTYRKDLNEEDRYNERMHIRAGSDRSIRSVLDVPFSYGTIAINSVEPEAFSTADIETLEEFAGVLSEAYTRFEDIRRVEESEEKYRSLVEHSQDVIFRVDPEGNYSVVSPAVEGLVGYTPEEFYADREIGRRIVLPEDFGKAEEGFRKAFSGEMSRDVEYRVRRKDGRIVWWASQTTYPVRDAEGRIVAIEGTIRDITERKRWHEIERMRYQVRSIQEPEEWLQAPHMLDEVLVGCGVEFSACGVNIVNLDERTMQMYTFEDHRLSETDFRGPTVPVIEAVVREQRTIYRCDTLVPGEFAEGFSSEQAMLGRRSVVDVPFVGGTVAMSSFTLDAFSQRDIETLEMVADVISEGYTRYMDLAERKRTEEALLQAAQHWQDTFDAIENPVAIVDRDYRVVRSNQTMDKTFSGATVVGAHCYELFHGTEGPIPNCPACQTLRSGKATHLELCEQHLGGRWFDIFVYPIKDADGAVQQVVHIARDITEERRIQQRVQEQERLAAVGQLAAGIAHDFNNLLAGMMGFAQLLRMREDMPEDAKEDLRRIEGEGQRAAQLIRQILDFSRKSMIQRKPLDLMSFLKESIKFLERTIPESICITLEMGSEEYLINAHPAQMQQVLTNLAVNARDAMPEGGELRFRLSRLTLEPGKRAPVPEMSPGEWVLLSVSDTGAGIPTDVKPRIFEPFFTTKDPARGHGTGLGLSQVYGIVVQHDGFIDVKSEGGEGTTFVIYLPALRMEEEMSGEEMSGEEMSEKLPRGGGEMILVVEDEWVVREMLGEMMEQLGYRPLTVANSAEALEVYDRQGDEIVLVLTDLVMPGMGGMELFHTLREQNPNIKMVVISGYPLEGEALLSQGIVGWIEKPVHLDKLARLVNEVLT